MKQWISLATLCIMLTACDAKKTEEKQALTIEQELHVVDSATQETKVRIEELGKSVNDLGHEVDSLLNENN